MKKFEAFIKKHRLNEVIELLHDIDELTGLSITDISGLGRTRNPDGPVRIVDNAYNNVSHVKIEVFCADALTETVVSAILEGGHTGLRGDGKIYISSVEDAVRISTRERGDEAV
jgi:nitrogen regulatory protein P-II 1